MSVVVLQGLDALLWPEAIVSVAGLVSLWVIWALRAPPEAMAVTAVI